MEYLLNLERLTNTLLYLANAIYVHAYKLKYNVGRASKEITKEVNALKAYQSSMPLSKFLIYLKLSFRNIIDLLYGDCGIMFFFDEIP